MRMATTLVLLLALAAPAAATPAEVAFVTPDGLYSMRADGSDRHPLVLDYRANSPAWSPDGTRLAYVNGGRIVIDGRAVTTPPKDANDAAPAWSPDGRAIVFGRAVGQYLDDDRRTQIVLYDTVTGSERVVLEQRTDATETSVGVPQFSPDNSSIAYTRARLDDEQTYEDDVFTIPVLGGMPKLLVRDAHSAVWSPDGTRLAFASIKDHNGAVCDEETCSWSPELYVSAADGSGARRLTVNEGSDSAPAWSPDGTRLLFDSDQNMPDADSDEIYSVAPDGRCLTWITNGVPWSVLPSFRPGSGDTFDPGSCNPADHPVRDEFPTPEPVDGGLWLGARFDGLLMSEAGPDEVYYRDCERFDAKQCPDPLSVSAEPACEAATWKWLLNEGLTYTRRRGAIFAYADAGADARVLSGKAITSISLMNRTEGIRPNTLRNAKRIADALRPYAATQATRLPPPRVPRAIARRLDHATRGRLVRLRALLRPYRFCSR